MSDQLKPCPMCGSPNASTYVSEAQDSSDEYWSVQCDKCGCEVSGLHDNKDDIVKNWNQRTPGPSTQVILDRMKACDWHNWSVFSPTEIEAFRKEWGVE